jgi:NADH-quinone oxidoreductase subunit J
LNAAFYISAAVAVISTVLVITRKSAIHALLYLVVSLLSVAVIFFTLGAPFIAALEVIIYAGAIMVLVIFVIMMLNLGSKAIEDERRLLKGGIWIGPSLLSFILIVELAYLLLNGGNANPETKIIGPKEIGMSLFGPYLLAVELASMLLLSGLIGAYHLGRHGSTSTETPGEKQ